MVGGVYERSDWKCGGRKCVCRGVHEGRCVDVKGCKGCVWRKGIPGGICIAMQSLSAVWHNLLCCPINLIKPSIKFNLPNGISVI